MHKLNSNLEGLPSTCAQIAEDAINKIMKCEL